MSVTSGDLGKDHDRLKDGRRKKWRWLKDLPLYLKAGAPFLAALAALISAISGH